MKSLRWRVTLWFAASVAAVMTVFIAVTFLHLRHELRLEKWERAQSNGAVWSLHGNYTDSEVTDIVGELWSLSLLYAAPALLLAMTAGYFVARRALRPVAEMNQQLQRITAASLGQRVNVSDADREVQEIQHAINALLGRLENSFSQLTEFSAQVAHELRTPLTLMRLQIEESAGKIDPSLADSFQDELSRLSDYVEQCLLLATAEQGRLSVRRERVRLDLLVNDVLEAYALLARGEHRTTRAVVCELEVETDPRYARQLLHILLSNALRHGSGDIVVTVDCDDHRRPRCGITNEVRNPSGTAKGQGLGLRVGRALAATLAIDFDYEVRDHQFRAALRFPTFTP